MMKVMIWIRYLVGPGKYYWFCNPGQGIPFRRLHPFSRISTTVHSVHEITSVPYRVIGRVNIQSLTNPNPDKLWPGPGPGCQTHRGLWSEIERNNEISLSVSVKMFNHTFNSINIWKRSKLPSVHLSFSSFSQTLWACPKQTSLLYVMFSQPYTYK